MARPRSMLPPHRSPRSWKPAVALAALIAAGTNPALANWRVSTDLGVGFAPGMDLFGGDNDRAARCDGFVNPRYAEWPGCTDPDRGAGAVDDWRNDFDGARGLLAGAAVGYRFSERWRAEVEYLFSESRYNEASPIRDPSGVPFVERFGPELPRAEERIGSVTLHGLFANVFFDMPVTTRLSLHVGAGAGAARTEIDYGALWARSLDPATVRTAAGLVNEDEVRRNLAGTVTSVNASPSATLLGYQMLAGADYRLSDALTLGLTLRWTRFDEFDRKGGPYDRLRSHPSNLRTDGSEPVTWRIATEDVEFVGATLRLAYEFR